MREHTYIFQEGTWEAHGKYFDSNNEYEVLSETSILHLEQEWILESHMELITNETHRFFNRYHIKPLAEKSDFTTWVAENPSLGVMRGKYMIVGDSILAFYQSDDGKYSGHEMMLRVNDEKYINRGYSFVGDQKMASWEVILMRTNL